MNDLDQHFRTQPDLLSLLARCRQKDGRWVADYRNLELSTAFQPIYSPAHGRKVGFEALVRARNAAGHQISPDELFDSVRTPAEVIQLDRLCRTLHVANFSGLSARDTWLFLNVDARVVTDGAAYGPFFANLLRHFAVPPEAIVVEVLEGAIPDERLLAEAINHYKGCGCLVALDDFGSGHSNFDRVVRLAPDIVKLDRSIILESTRSQVARRILPNLVALLHEAGCLVLLEGIENTREALLALDADADFTQGFLFARPVPPEQLKLHEANPFQSLDADFQTASQQHREERDRALATYLKVFQHAATAVSAGIDDEVACSRLLSMDRVLRCYVLDDSGRQVGTNQVNPARDRSADPRFRPLYHVKGANWYRRPYFRNALSEPGRTQVTRPYLSLIGAGLCVTLSRAVQYRLETRILCCDIDWEDEPGTCCGP